MKVYPAIIFTLTLLTPLVLIQVFPVLSQGVSEERRHILNSIIWDIQTVDSAGNPHISYCEDVCGAGNLKYARWIGSEWHIQTVDSVGVVGWSTSLVMDSGGNLHIAYCHTTAGVKYAGWTGSGWNIQTVTSGSQPSLKLNSAGNPHISYYNCGDANCCVSDLKYAKGEIPTSTSTPTSTPTATPTSTSTPTPTSMPTATPSPTPTPGLKDKFIYLLLVLK